MSLGEGFGSAEGLRGSPGGVAHWAGWVEKYAENVGLFIEAGNFKGAKTSLGCLMSAARELAGALEGEE